MICKITRKITITEEERKVIKELINFIESSFSVDDIDDDPELVVDIMTGLYCGNDLIYTNGYGEISVEYIKDEIIKKER